MENPLKELDPKIASIMVRIPIISEPQPADFRIEK